jgi:hypothetical protein
MRFKFKNIPVEINEDGKLTSDDQVTTDLLSPLIEDAASGPEEGNPYIIAITDVHGPDSVTEVEDDQNDLIN